MRGGEPVTLTDVIARFGKPPVAGGGPSEAMVLPLTGEPPKSAGAIVLAASAGRALDEDNQSFGLVAQQTAALVDGAVAYQAQLRRAESLAELDRAKTTFFSNVSHEFRTPLTLILGPLDDAIRDTTERRGRRRPAGTLHRNALRLQKLVNTLLDFSCIEARRVRVSFQPVDLAALTRELASNFQSACDKAGLELVVNCATLPEPVYVDAEMWEKVVLNLLSNAFKFTFEGTVSVRLGEEDGHAVLRVADTGIAAAEIPCLFDRFHRIENMPSRSNEGSGIGLALVRELIALHGGHHHRLRCRACGGHVHGQDPVRPRAPARRQRGRRAGRVPCPPRPTRSSRSRRCAGCRATRPRRRARRYGCCGAGRGPRAPRRRRASPGLRAARRRQRGHARRTCGGCCAPDTRSTTVTDGQCRAGGRVTPARRT